MRETYDAVIAKALGKRIRRLRDKYLLRQVDLAEMVGSKQRSISDMERGLYIPSVVVLVKLAAVDGLSLSEFLEGVI